MAYQSYPGDVMQLPGLVKTYTTGFAAEVVKTLGDVVSKALKPDTKVLFMVDAQRQSCLYFFPYSQMTSRTSDAAQVIDILKRVAGVRVREAAEGVYAAYKTAPELNDEVAALYREQASCVVPWTLIVHNGGEEIIDSLKVSRLSLTHLGELVIEYNDRILTLSFGEGETGLVRARQARDKILAGVRRLV